MAGWYRRNKSRGIAWAGLWEQPHLKAYLLENGVIEFEFFDGGREVIQTARPMPQRNTQRRTKGATKMIYDKNETNISGKVESFAVVNTKTATPTIKEGRSDE
jgi:hypothetical protein